MKIFVNGKVKEIPEGKSLLELREELGIIQNEGFAFAINNQLIPHSKHSFTVLCESDQVLIIQATQGG